MPLPTVFVAAAVLQQHSGEILLAQRPYGKSMAGLWEFPGGKIESGEKPRAALVRELAEELAIAAAPDDCLPLTFVEYAYPDFLLLMPVYLLRRWQGDIRPQEAQATIWVPPQNIQNYPMPPADVDLIAVLPRLLSVF
jgi:8-oxo-dGTP diphosphatase